MRTSTRLRALLPAPVAAVAVLVLVAVTVPIGTPTAYAAPTPPPAAGGAPAGGPVGGAALGSRGVVAPRGAPPLPAPLSASSWLVADLDTGSVLAARDAHGRYAPASTIKTLTALALLPRLAAGRPVVPTAADVAVDGSKVGLVAGIRYPARELFTSMLVVSGNDAANALASAAGGAPRTVALMNAEAAHLHAGDTRAVNPSGLDAAGQTSSAYDLALIGRAGMTRADFRSYVSVRRSTVAAPGGKRFEIATHNRLLRNYPGAVGIKNGFTVRARASFVGAATRGGHRLVVVLMHADPRVWHEAAALLDWGFLATARGTAPVGVLVAAGDPPGAPAAVEDTGTGTPLIDAPVRVLTRVQGSTPLPYAATGAVMALLTLLVLRRRRRLLERRRGRVPLR